MAGIWDGIGAVIGKVTQWVPGRVEALKNEKEKLLNERQKLIHQPEGFSIARGNRVIAIDERLSKINAALSNKAGD